jgi:hypothetical protein
MGKRLAADNGDEQSCTNSGVSEVVDSVIM